MAMELDDLKFNFGCASCGYKHQDPDGPIGTISVKRVIEKLDEHFAVNDMAGAGRLLDYWRQEAFTLRDRQGELSIVNEQLGYFRKIGDEAKALEAVSRSLELIEKLDAWDTVSSATIFLNAATTLKAFGRAEEALPLYENTLSIYKENLSEDDLLFGGFYNNYALALADLGRYQEAEDCYLSALAVVLPDEKGRLDGAVTYVNMAHLYELWEERTDADITACLENGLEILDDKTIEQNGYLAFVLSKCAPSYQHFGMDEVATRLSKLSEELYARH